MNEVKPGLFYVTEDMNLTGHVRLLKSQGRASDQLHVQDTVTTQKNGELAASFLGSTDSPATADEVLVEATS